MSYDLLIKNGRVVDGSGMPSFYGDVAVKGGKIVGVGKFSSSAVYTINADGRVVSPGFIDNHTHYDCQVVWDPFCSSTAENGNTSVIVGNCGLVLAPIRKGDEDWYLRLFNSMENIPLEALQSGVKVSWEDIAGYMGAIGQRRGVNVGVLMGHSGVRRYVMGEACQERAVATQEEIEAMKQVVKEGMESGALGFTMCKFTNDVDGMGTVVPASLATDEERLALASVLAEMGVGVLQKSGGAPGGTYDPARFSVDFSLKTGLPCFYNLISHEVAKPDEWKEHLKFLEDASKSGARAYAMCFSQVAGPIFTLDEPVLGENLDEDQVNPNQVFAGFPTWDAVMRRPVEDRIKAFRDPDTRKRLREEAVEGIRGVSRYRRGRGFQRRWDLVTVFLTYRERNRKWSGKSIEQIAQEQGKDIMDAFLDIAVDEDLHTKFQLVDRNSDPEAVSAILNSPHTVIGTSDGGARPHTQDRQTLSTQLLAQWVREKPVMSLEKAVWLLSFRAASLFGIHDRGLLRPGWAADILVFDPDTIAPKAPEPAYDLPDGGMRVRVPVTGLNYVIVNGEVLLEDGNHTGVYPGQVLRNALYDANH